MRTAYLLVAAALVFCTQPALAENPEEELVAQRIYNVAFKGRGGSGEFEALFLKKDGALAVQFGSAHAQDIRLSASRLTFNFSNEKRGVKRVIDTVLNRQPDGTWTGYMTGPSSNDPNYLFTDQVVMKPRK